MPPTHERKLIPITPEKAEYLSKSINSLTVTLNGANWRLSGGLSIALHLATYPFEIVRNTVPSNLPIINGFYREHQALHISCLEQDLERLTQVANNKGYQLSMRLPMAKGWEREKQRRKLEWHVRITPWIATHVGNIRLIKKGADSKHPDILDYIDVYPHSFATEDLHEKKKRYVEVNRISIPSEFFVNTRTKEQVNPERVVVISGDDDLIVPVKFYRGQEYQRDQTLPKLKLIHPMYMLRVKNREIKIKNQKNLRDITDFEILYALAERRGLKADADQIVSPKPL